jgi:hypothetical protein
MLGLEVIILWGHLILDVAALILSTTFILGDLCSVTKFSLPDVLKNIHVDSLNNFQRRQCSALSPVPFLVNT